MTKYKTIVVINSKEEFKDWFYYEPAPEIDEYPKEYPCICWQTEHAGGLMGDYVSHSIHYFPDDLTASQKQLYAQGFDAGRNEE